MLPFPIRFLLILCASLCFIALFFFLPFSPPKLTQRPVQMLGKLILYFHGTKIRRTGSLPQKGSLVLFNHTSWLDIIIIHATLPICFISKKEVAEIPFIGWFSHYSRPLFIDRTKKQDIDVQKTLIQKRLRQNCRLGMFAEGQTGDGVSVAPFKPALLAACAPDKGHPPTIIHPCSVAYTAQGGLTLGRRGRQNLASPKGVASLKELLRLFRSSSLLVDVIFHTPHILYDKKDRKDIARKARKQVQAGLTATMVGHNLDGTIRLGHLND